MQDDYNYNDSMMMRDDDDYYYNNNNMNYYDDDRPRLFGNGQYFNDSSEDFRVTSRSADRGQRRNYLRYAPSGEGGGSDRRPRETAFGGRRTNGDSFGFNERTYGGDFDNFRQGNGFRGNRRLGGGGSSTIGVRDELEERREQRLQQERERRYNNQRRGGADMSRWGWQQQYDPKRGNVRNGSSNDFRRGRTYNGMRDLYTPREREMKQMQDNARLSQSVSMGASSSSSQQGDSRGVGRGGRRVVGGQELPNYSERYYGDGDREVQNGKYGYGQDGYGYGRNGYQNDNMGYQEGDSYNDYYPDYGFERDDRDYYDPEIVGRSGGRENSGKRFRNSLRNFKEFFNTGF